MKTSRYSPEQIAMALRQAEAGTPVDLDRAFTEIIHHKADGLGVEADQTTVMLWTALVGLAARHRLPAIYRARVFAEAGGLMSYGADVQDLYHRAATYVDKILKGAKPADLPIEQPTKFEFVINLKTAKALGLTIPPAVLARADEIIQ